MVSALSPVDTLRDAVPALRARGLDVSGSPESRPLPVVLAPRDPAVRLDDAAAACGPQVRDLVHSAGAVLLRGFADTTVGTFEALVRRLFGEPLDYVERSSPRHAVMGNVFTSTDHPHDQRIHLHNEQSYNLRWPSVIAFHCVVEPAAGGETPLADCRRVHDRLPEALRARFAGGYRYHRYFGGGLGLSWQEAFRTPHRSEVERYCRANAIEFAWGEDDTLATRQVRGTVSRHPRTGEEVWFNHATFFHVSTLGEATAARLLDLLGRDCLPNNTYFADGEEIDAATLETLRAAYEAETRTFPWARGDVLLLDNMLVAHGRAPFTPPREIVVAMA